MLALALVLAVAIGVFLGLLGGGGSILTIPVFVYVLKFSPKEAIAMSLPVVCATSLFGAARQRSYGEIDTKLGVLFGCVSFAGARLSAQLAERVSGDVQLALLAVVMLSSAIFMLRTQTDQDQAARAERRLHLRERHLYMMAGVAFLVGTITGLVGVGGGFLFVPSLVVLSKMEMRTAAGTSLLAISINTAGAFLGYAGHVQIRWGFLVAFTLVAMGGILVGTHLQRFITHATLRHAFGVFLIVAGGLMLYDRGTKVLRERRAPARQTTASTPRAAPVATPALMRAPPRPDPRPRTCC